MAPITIQSADELFDEQEEIEEFRKAANPFLILAVIAGAALAIEGIVDPTITPEEVSVLPATIEAINTMSLQQAARALDTSILEVNKLLEQSLEEGLSNEQFANLITAKYTEFKNYRALRIARTETTNAINTGTLEAFKAEGVERKVWVAVLDDRTRETHAAVDAETHRSPIPVGDNFNVGGFPAKYPSALSLPAGERINCRCTMVSSNFTELFEKNYCELFLRQHSSIETPFQARMKKEFENQLKRILSRL